jgi:hypothetical protein
MKQIDRKYKRVIGTLILIIGICGLFLGTTLVFAVISLIGLPSGLALLLSTISL